MKQTTPPKVQKFPPAKQRRMDRLLEKNGEGTLTTREKAMLEQLVAEAEQLMVANAERLAEFFRKQGASPPAGAVPVTVWVQPQRAEP